MSEIKNNTSLHGSLNDVEEDSKPLSAVEFDEYLHIFTKSAETRKSKETEKLINKLIELSIFDRSLLNNLDPKAVITKLMPFFKYEHFPAGAPIFHYEQPADKLYLILKGKAKEFGPKSIDTLEKESHTAYKADPFRRNKASFSMPELPHSNTSRMDIIPEGSLQHLETVEEEPKSEAKEAFDVAKKFRKMKALMPFLKQIVGQKTVTQRVNDYSYKQSLRRPRNMKTGDESIEITTPDSLGKNVNIEVLEEFKRFPRAYFIGGILKVQFMKYLYAGDHCGLRALKDNSLRTRAVIAESDCHCLSLDREDFYKVLENEKALNVDKIEFFKQLFDKFDEKRVAKFALLWEYQGLKLGDLVFQQNEPSDHLYALFTGEVILSKTIMKQKAKASLAGELPFRIKKRNDQNGSTLRVATLCGRDFFGDHDFFQGQNREFTASVSSTRAKLFRLPIQKYQETYKEYWEIFKEIKNLMSIKAKWNKERMEGLNQNLCLSLIQNQKSKLEHEKTKNQISQLLPASCNSLYFDLPHTDKSRQSPKRNESLTRIPLDQTTTSFSAHKFKPDGKPCIISEDVLRSPKSTPYLNVVDPSRLNIKMTPSNNTTSMQRLKEKLDIKMNNQSLEVGADRSMNMFARMKPLGEYTTKQEELIKKNKEAANASFEFFGTKRTPKKRKTVEPDRDATSTPSASVKMLKKKIYDINKSNAMTDSKLAPSLPSLDLDNKPHSLVFGSPKNASNMIINSLPLSNKNIHNTALALSHSTRARRTKQKSIDKSSFNALDISEGPESKTQIIINPNMSQYMEKSGRNENSFQYYQPNGLQSNLRSSVKLKQMTEMSKSLTQLKLITKKTDKSESKGGEESCKGFRIMGSKATSEGKRLAIGKLKVVDL